LGKFIDVGPTLTIAFVESPVLDIGTLRFPVPVAASV